MTPNPELSPDSELHSEHPAAKTLANSRQRQLNRGGRYLCETVDGQTGSLQLNTERPHMAHRDVYL